MEKNIHLDSVAKAREEVAVKNIESVVEYSKATRSIANNCASEVKQLKLLIAQQNMKIDELEGLIRKFLIKNYSGNFTTE